MAYIQPLLLHLFSKAMQYSKGGTAQAWEVCADLCASLQDSIAEEPYLKAPPSGPCSVSQPCPAHRAWIIIGMALPLINHISQALSVLTVFKSQASGARTRLQELAVGLSRRLVDLGFLAHLVLRIRPELHSTAALDQLEADSELRTQATFASFERNIAADLVRGPVNRS